MNRRLSGLIATTWLIGSAALAAAQTDTSARGEPGPVQHGLTPAQKYADCLGKHGNQPRQRQKCEDSYTAANVRESRKAERTQAQLERKAAKQGRHRTEQ